MKAIKLRNMRNFFKRTGTEDSLKMIEEGFPYLFDVIPEGVLILDIKSQKFVSHNENALKMLKFSHEEMLEQGPESISPEFQPDGVRSVEKAKELIGRALNGEKPVFEWMIKNGEGEMRFFEGRLSFLSGLGSTPLIYASFIDITERKKEEERLLRQNKQLEQIGFLQSHQVRAPIANILGLLNLFNFENLHDPLNAELIKRLSLVTQQFDDVIKLIMDETKKVDSLTFGCGKNGSTVCNPSTSCPSIKSCFKHKE